MSKIIGYTTIDREITSQTLTGLELAKRDLLNHFHIRKGERWTNPTFGSMLPYYVFEPLDENTIELITEDVFTVVSYDPRFEMTSNFVNVREDEHSITIEVQLLYIPTTTATDLQIKFDREFGEPEQI
jgi:phage baseplate assembly protein W